MNCFVYAIVDIIGISSIGKLITVLRLVSCLDQGLSIFFYLRTGRRLTILLRTTTVAFLKRVVFILLCDVSYFSENVDDRVVKF